MRNYGNNLNGRNPGQHSRGGEWGESLEFEEGKGFLKS